MEKRYRPVFGHVNGIEPGALFASRKDVKAAKLHKAEEDGISWGRDIEGRYGADAIVLNNGYEDDVDDWTEITYTGVGGRTRDSQQQVSDQDWGKPGNAGLSESCAAGHPIRVIRGSSGEKDYSPPKGYRYDGLYQIVKKWDETGKAGFLICRFLLRRLPSVEQELIPLEDQLRSILKDVNRGTGDGRRHKEGSDGPAPRRTTTVERIVRDTEVARRVKRWHNFTCQFCSVALAVGEGGRSYAEGAHIHALGGQDGGPDVDGNVLCLCPNCHVRFDRGALYLTDSLRVIDRFPAAGAHRSAPLRQVPEHRVRERFVRAHRRRWGIEDEVVAERIF
ncbi:YDG/SRA domain-containing protein [Streptomyces sp. NPDC005576]|uniref:YDG/SRA domain-containing protein n=1 Tax=unclassified Streptomyces TaxID=2593676 RepID=UPI0033F2968C